MSETEKLMAAHQEAQAARRALELEQRELPGKLDYAISQADVGEIQTLNRRKRELPEAYQTASAIEHSAYGAFVKAQSKQEAELWDEAQAAADAAENQLVSRRKEWAEEDALLVQALEKAQIRRSSHEREVEAWSTRFSRADARFRGAIAEQQEAA
jgi:hypothetical protein